MPGQNEGKKARLWTLDFGPWTLDYRVYLGFRLWMMILFQLIH
jgi:hypothetical protein